MLCFDLRRQNSVLCAGKESLCKEKLKVKGRGRLFAAAPELGAGRGDGFFIHSSLPLEGVALIKGGSALPLSLEEKR